MAAVLGGQIQALANLRFANHLRNHEQELFTALASVERLLRRHLHDDLGLSVLFIHDHLCKWHSMADPMPEVEFLRCIARITQAPRLTVTRPAR